MTPLFSTTDLSDGKAKPGVGRDRLSRRIGTGTPRWMEASGARLKRQRAEAWEAFLVAIRQSARGRLELLKGRAAGDPIGCPWGILVTCDGSCRCGGSRMVTVAFLRDHYASLAKEIARLVQRSSP